MKKLSKILSVGLSLVMCASMVAPGFAASFADLQNAIDTGEDQYNDAGNISIGASKDDAGAVNVTLYEKVVFDAGKDTGSGFVVEGSYQGTQQNLNLTAGIVIDTDVAIDLNGYDIDGDGKVGSVIKIDEGGELTLTDSTATGSAEEGTYESGAITGGVKGGGVYNEGNFTMDGGRIAENEGTSSWLFDQHVAGGVTNADGGTFTMNDGTIEDNKGTGSESAGGVYNGEESKFTMNGGAIEDNTSRQEGAGGVYNQGGTFTMNGGTIKGNEDSSVGAGGVKNEYGTFTMTDGTIEGNSGRYAGGVWNRWDSTFNMEGGTIEGNVSLYSGGVMNGLQSSQDTETKTTFNMSGNASITGNVGVMEGGGLESHGGTVNMSGNASITGNASLSGGGVIIRLGEITMTDNATIADNTAAGGAGVILDAKSALIMKDNASIEKNNASLTKYIAILEDTEVNSESQSYVNAYINPLKGKADTGRGGGVYVVTGNVKLTMSDKAKIRNNTAAHMGDDICTYDPATVSLVEFNLIKDSQWKLDNPVDREEGAEEQMFLGQDTRSFDARKTAVKYVLVDSSPSRLQWMYGLTFCGPDDEPVVDPDPDPDPNPNPDPDPNPVPNLSLINNRRCRRKE
ncbi:MAG: hypothetical protein K2M42_10770, partial [Oscillospiraceae bacterium]|nr:hypothetical protein [Oscillospiraceae bacterium]